MGKTVEVLRVYLDQNKWIDLARAAVGHPKGERFQDALTICRAAVAAGVASFPLDMYRYWETSKRGDPRSRLQVVEVMRKLSQGHTIAVPFDILDHEIDCALARLFDVPLPPRRIQIFGVGLHHVAGSRMQWPMLDLTSQLGGVPPAVALRAQGAFQDYLEEELLRVGPTTPDSTGVDHRRSDHADRFVDFETQLAALIKEQRLTGRAVDLAVRGADFLDIRPAVTEALERIGMTYDDFTSALSGIGLLRFIDDLPTRYVTNVLRGARHRETQQPWEPNDFVDIVALPVPAVYCDVVVTEKQWAHRMRRGQVEGRYATRVISNLADITDVLVSAYAA